MEEILKKLMNTRCVAMHNPSMRCYGKGCNGQCAQFQVALDAIVTKKCITHSSEGNRVML